MENNKIVLSPLDHTWILDLDGTMLKHNGYKTDGKDTILKGVTEFFSQIPDSDMVIILTSRKEDERKRTIRFLNENKLRYNHIIFNVPFGERILINDNKQSGLKTACAINLVRDSFDVGTVYINKNL